MKPRAVVLEFSGNDSTPCISAAAMYSPNFYVHYEDDTQRAISLFTSVGAHVFLVGYPPTFVDVAKQVTQWNDLNVLYALLAQRHGGQVTYVNAQEAVELDGKFTWTMPCTKDAAHCGEDGSNVVRAEDGQHFCPQPAKVNLARCLTYSSGSSRYASAIAEAVNQFVKQGHAPTYIGPQIPPPNTLATVASNQPNPYLEAALAKGAK